MIGSFPKNKVIVSVLIVIDDMPVDRVATYKYLGVLVDHKHSFSSHVEAQVKKANKRMYCLRSMYKVNVSKDILILFYNATIATVLTYANIAF